MMPNRALKLTVVLFCLLPYLISQYEPVCFIGSSRAAVGIMGTAHPLRSNLDFRILSDINLCIFSVLEKKCVMKGKGQALFHWLTFSITSSCTQMLNICSVFYSPSSFLNMSLCALHHPFNTPSPFFSDLDLAVDPDWKVNPKREHLVSPPPHQFTHKGHPLSLHISRLSLPYCQFHCNGHSTISSQSHLWPKCRY